MQIAPDLFLTYCTNIHPANGWADVREGLERHAPALRAALAPSGSFALGLRLSGAESRELLAGDALARFKDFLDAHGLVVFTLNGFPYGPFHRQRVKDQVHAPDWRDAERVRYTLRLAEILARLLPDGMDGGISTNPLAYRGWFTEGVDPETWRHMTRHVVEVVAALVRLRRETGRFIHLDVEPEPDGLLDNSRDLVHYFDTWLLPEGAPMLAFDLGTTRAEAEALLLEHVQVCWDACHAAVSFEPPEEVLARYAARGIRVGRLQVSTALRVPLPADPSARTRLAERLTPFVDAVYLHQVVQRGAGGALRAFPDLDVALPALHDPDAAEWRIHFHVPVFAERFGDLFSTQDDLLRTFGLLRRRPFTRYLEVETYTWDVLPPHLKQPLGASIQRELEWVLGAVAPTSTPAARHA